MLKASQKRIYFCHIGRSSFVQVDIDLLKEKYILTEHEWCISKSFFGKVFTTLDSFFGALIHVPRADVVYVYFGGYHGFFPILFAKIFSKKSMVIVGGFDASFIPSLNYGVFFHHNLLQWCIRRMYIWADIICPVDESLVESVNKFADITGKGFKTGILNHMKLTRAKINVIHLGFRPHLTSVPKKAGNSVISIAKISNQKTFEAKGFNFILKISKLLPTVTFTIVGMTNEMIEYYSNLVGENVVLEKDIDSLQLLKLLENASVIFHPSLTEGFCSVIVEGMLAGCVPVGSNVGGIKRSIGDTGFVLENQDIEAMVSGLRIAQKNAKILGPKARKRAKSMYPLEKRRVALYQLIEDK